MQKIKKFDAAYLPYKIGIIADVLESADKGNKIRRIIYLVHASHQEIETNVSKCIKFLEEHKMLKYFSPDVYTTTKKGSNFLEEYKKTVLLGLSIREYNLNSYFAQ